MMSFYAISIFLIINSAFSVEIEGFSESDSAIRHTCSEKITSNGTGDFSVPKEQNCFAYYIDIECEKKDSIINLTVQYVWNHETSSSNKSIISQDSNNVAVDVYEMTKNFPKEYVLLENWNLETVSSLTNLSYLTVTPEARIRISGDWSGYDIKFFYHEYKYELQENGFLDGEGEITLGEHYRPNCVHVYLVSQVRNMNVSSIQIILHYLDIDTRVGEYLMIGEGNDVLRGSPSLFITQAGSNSVYYVNGDSAYIVFVSNSRRKEHRGFKISWMHTGTKIIKVDEPTEDLLDILHSRAICFYNSSGEPENDENLGKEVTREFKARIVETAKKYARQKQKEMNYKSLSASSVNIYKPSTAKAQEKGMNPRNPTMYILIVKDSSTRKPAFKWKELGEIIDRFEDATKENPIYGYKVGKCPRGFTYTKVWSLLIYASVPTFGFFFLMIWAWKQKIFKQACMLPNAEQKYPDPLANPKTAQQNPYEFSIPKVVLENDRGRRRTLDHKNSFQNDEDERDNDEEHASERSSSLTDPDSANLKELINKKQNRRRPSIQSLLRENEEPYTGKTQEHDEHFYDSVACDAEINETRL